MAAKAIALENTAERSIEWHEIVRLAFLEGKSIGDGYTDAEAQEMWPHSASAALIEWDEYAARRDAQEAPK